MPNPTLSTLRKNRRALNRTLDVFRQVSDAKFYLLLAERDADAEKLEEELSKLEKDINALRGKMLDDWAAKVPMLIETLAKMSTEVKEAVDDIKDDIETAQEVVALIGKVDSVIRLIGPLLL